MTKDAVIYFLHTGTEQLLTFICIILRELDVVSKAKTEY